MPKDLLEEAMRSSGLSLAFGKGSDVACPPFLWLCKLKGFFSFMARGLGSANPENRKNGCAEHGGE